jgi:hypothetical protein
LKIVSSETPAAVIEAGLKLAVAPAGNPDTLRLTVPLKPFTRLTLTFGYPTLPPAAIETDTGVVVRNKVSSSIRIAHRNIIEGRSARR